MHCLVIAKRIKRDCYTFLCFHKHQKVTLKKPHDVWITFCKHKSFNPTKCTRIWSLHFSSDAYALANLPEFLKSIEFTGKRRYLLKHYAVPAENKLLPATHEGQNPKRSAGTLSRRRVVEVIISNEQWNRKTSYLQQPATLAIPVTSRCIASRPTNTFKIS